MIYIRLSVYVSEYLFTFIYVSLYLNISKYLSIPSIHPSIHPSTHPPTHPSIHPSIHPSESICFYLYLYIYIYIYSRIHIGAPVVVAIPYQALLPSSFSHLRKYSLWGFSCVFVPALFCPSAHLSPTPFQRPPQRPPAWQSPQPLMPSTCAVAELR